MENKQEKNNKQSILNVIMLIAILLLLFKICIENNDINITYEYKGIKGESKIYDNTNE